MQSSETFYEFEKDSYCVFEIFPAALWSFKKLNLLFGLRILLFLNCLHLIEKMVSIQGLK